MGKPSSWSRRALAFGGDKSRGRRGWQAGCRQQGALCARRTRAPLHRDQHRPCLPAGRRWRPQPAGPGSGYRDRARRSPGATQASARCAAPSPAISVAARRSGLAPGERPPQRRGARRGRTAQPVVKARGYRAPDHRGNPDVHLRQAAGTAAFRTPAPGAARSGRRGALGGAGLRVRQPRRVAHAATPAHPATAAAAPSIPSGPAPASGAAPADATAPAGPAPGTGVPRCNESQLTAGTSAYQTRRLSGTGQRGITITLTNTGSTSCSLYGYPGLGLEDTAHHVLPSHTRWGHGLVAVPAALREFAAASVSRSPGVCDSARWSQSFPVPSSVCIHVRSLARCVKASYLSFTMFPPGLGQVGTSRASARVSPRQGPAWLG
jgi:Protein of unknown function (DUF4232)